MRSTLVISLTALVVLSAAAIAGIYRMPKTLAAQYSFGANSIGGHCVLVSRNDPSCAASRGDEAVDSAVLKKSH